MQGEAKYSIGSGVAWFHEGVYRLLAHEPSQLGRSMALDGEPATVTVSVAETVSVLADPSPPPRTALPEQLVLGRERYGR